MNLELVKELCDSFPKPVSFKPSYGTAGFRAEGSLLHSTLFRCGILMAMRSMKTSGITGIVVTASHNPAEDNGVKLIEPTGYMLTQSWEAHADDIAIASNAQELCRALEILSLQEGLQEGSPATVWIAHDTRPSWKELVSAACQGVESVGGRVEVKGLLTTPQLHWMVRQRNKGLVSREDDYYKALAEAYRGLTGRKAATQELVVDCANGVGAHKLKMLQRQLPELRLDLRNSGSGPLNGSCGADFVQKGSNGAPCLPEDFQDVPSSSRCVSIDGDADRIVYFSPTGKGNFTLLDGDRIAVLAAILINSLVEKLRQSSPISVGIVQTAYANGSSTQYIREQLGMTVLRAKTGVKHLHHLAESFDIGIYFEANGHGTILFKESLLQELDKERGSNNVAKAILEVAQMVNQAVGDALSCLLFVEVALLRQQWSLQQWADLYTDLPSCMLKVKVPDRSVFETADAETRVVSPAGLQSKIDDLLASFSRGRSFVRPSGTEDVVRVYAEADTKEAADRLAHMVADRVQQSVQASRSMATHPVL